MLPLNLMRWLFTKPKSATQNRHIIDDDMSITITTEPGKLIVTIDMPETGPPPDTGQALPGAQIIPFRKAG